MAENTHPDDTTASLAVYHGPATRITEHKSVEEAIAAADRAIRKGRQVLACVRDGDGALVYAADSKGRTWHADELEGRGKHLDPGENL